MIAFRLANAILGGSATQTPVDIDVADGRITRVADAGETSTPHRIIDLDRATVVPGLWDEHVHIEQWAVYRSRANVLAATSAIEAAAIARIAAGAHRGNGPLILVGMRDGLWPDAPTRALLDEAVGQVPTLIVSSDLHCSWPSTAFVTAEGLDADTVLLREADAFGLLQRLGERATPHDIDQVIVEACAAAAARGVVGLVDLEFLDAVGAWERRAASTPLRVSAGVYPHDLALAESRGLRGGAPIAGRATVGHLKVLSDGSLGTRTAWTHHPYDGTCGVSNFDASTLDELLRRGTALGLDATIHAIGDAAMDAALDAFARAGVGGRIEHAQLATDATVARMGTLGITASVQPEHALDDRELTERLWADRRHDAFRLRSFLDAGVPLALGSDAPVTPLDPWIAIATATTRTRGDETPWQPDEAITLAQALAASARVRIGEGQPADLVILDDALPTDETIAQDPNAAAAQLRGIAVSATLIEGEPVYGALS